jgi:hypothetical protein
MGNNPVRAAASALDRSVRPTDVVAPSWLDAETCALVQDTVATMASEHPELQAVVLYGSVARQNERPLTNPHPSDVDLLFIFDRDPDSQPLEWELGIHRSEGQALRRHMGAPRELQAMFAAPDLRGWDVAFIENVARDGLLLWARGSLPSLLAPVERRPIALAPA